MDNSVNVETIASVRQPRSGALLSREPPAFFPTSSDEEAILIHKPWGLGILEGSAVNLRTVTVARENAESGL
jgi:hypothetical protein